MRSSPDHPPAAPSRAPASDALAPDGQALVVDHALIERFGGRGPRYTSYPTADRFDAGTDEAAYRDALAERGARAHDPLGLYLHIPFCRSICYYCGCNKVGTRHQSRSAEYVDVIAREIAMVADALGTRQRISHLHLGGGTPTFMLDDEFVRLFATIDRHVDREPDGEYSIEVDPRTVGPERLRTLRELGLNRISLGIQDFDPAVQQAVNRLQSYEDTRALFDASRELGFGSINADLIYGLPRQSVAGFERTLERLLALAPDRVALYQYAHLPQLFKPQRRIHEADLPDAATRAAIFDLAVARFRDAGYAYLGLDHFARHDDELAVAQREGRLHRNFQGYCSHDAGDIIALGVSSISSVGRIYAQNEKSLDAYYARIAAGRLPTVRGARLSDDDLVRRTAIQSLMCGFRLDWDALGAACGVDARHYFADAASSLEPMARAGAITLDAQGIVVRPQGRLLVRAVAMAFDRYLRERAPAGTYSRLA